MKLALPVVVALAFFWLAGIEAYRWRLLTGHTAQAQASVTAARRNPSSKAFGGPPFQMQYQFQVGRSDPSYHYTGQLLIFERWVRVPEEVLLSPNLVKTIRVSYAPSDPRINQPASMAPPTQLNAIGFSVFAFLSLLAALIIHKDPGGKSNNSFKPNPLRGSA